MRRFFSVEYIDLEGDPNVKHAFMDEDELEDLTDTLTRLGAIGVYVNDLTPPASGVAVLSGYEDDPRLESGT